MTTHGSYISDPQLRRAYALAAAHGHQWASDVWEHVESGGKLPQTLDDARSIEAAADLSPPLPAGVSVPEPDPDGSIHHRTGSGRLRWTVGPDGRANLRVYRPDPSRPDSAGRMVARAVVRPDGRTSLEGSGAYGRHCAALWTALEAVHRADAEAEAKAMEAAARETILAAGEGGLVSCGQALVAWLDRGGYLASNYPPRVNLWAKEWAQGETR